MLSCLSVCIYLLIYQISHLTRIALSPDDKFDYEMNNHNMTDLDPDFNRTPSNNVLTIKYYLENDFNDIIKCNNSYAKGLSLLLLFLMLEVI